MEFVSIFPIYKFSHVGWYRDAAGKTTEENSSIFSLIHMY